MHFQASQVNMTQLHQHATLFHAGSKKTWGLTDTQLELCLKGWSFTLLLRYCNWQKHGDLQASDIVVINDYSKAAKFEFVAASFSHLQVILRVT